MKDPFDHVLTPAEADAQYVLDLERDRSEDVARCAQEELEMSFSGDNPKMDERTHIYDACGLSLRVTTTGPKGGDGGHGGWTGVILEGDAMLFEVRTGHEGALDEEVDADWLRIMCRGDAEGRVLATGLRWLADCLEKVHGFTECDAPLDGTDPAVDPAEL